MLSLSDSSYPITLLGGHITHPSPQGPPSEPQSDQKYHRDNQICHSRLFLYPFSLVMNSCYQENYVRLTFILVGSNCRKRNIDLTVLMSILICEDRILRELESDMIESNTSNSAMLKFEIRYD